MPVAAIPIGLQIFILLAITAAVYVLTPRPTFTRPPQDRLGNYRDQNAPWRVIYGETRVGGVIVFAEQWTGAVDYVNLVYAICAHEIEEITSFWINGEEVPVSYDSFTKLYSPSSGKYVDAITWQVLTGARSSGFAAFGAGSDHYDATTMQFNGHTVIWASLNASNGAWNAGIPELTWQIKGKNDIYDPRTDTSGWTDNCGLCWNDYLCESRLGVGADYDTEVNETELIATANLCDEDVETAAGPDEPRYIVGCMFTLDADKEEILAAFAAACSGNLVYVSGEWYMRGGAYRAPVLTLTEDSFVGPIEIQTRLSRRELGNAVKGLYVAKDQKFVDIGYPPVTNATYQTEDGERIWLERDYQFVTSPGQAQRLAKIDLEEVRQQITVKGLMKLEAYLALPGETVKITLSRYGWDEKVFKVSSTKLTQIRDESSSGLNAGAPAIEVLLRETASTVYDWNSGEETEVDPSLDTDLPNIHDIPEPENFQLLSDETTAIVNSDETVQPRIKLTWDDPEPISSVAVFEVRFRKSSGPGAWERRRSAIPEDAANECFIENVESGVQYDVAIRSVSRLIVPSVWVQLTVLATNLDSVINPGSPHNMVFDGDFNDPVNWKFSEGSEVLIKPDADAVSDWSHELENPGNVYDSNETNFAHVDLNSDLEPEVNAARNFTFPSGVKTGKLRVEVEGAANDSNMVGAGVKCSYSLDGSPWIAFMYEMYILNSTTGDTPLYKSIFESESMTVDLDDLRVYLGSWKWAGGANGDARTKFYRLWFVELSASPYSSVSNSQLTIIGNGTLEGIVRRDFPGRAPKPKEIVFADTSRCVTQIYLKRLDPDTALTQNVQVYLVRTDAGPGDSTEWKILDVPAEDIVADWTPWAQFTIFDEPVTGSLEIQVRTKDTAGAIGDSLSVHKGGTAWGFSPNRNESTSEGNQPEARDAVYPRGQWTGTGDIKKGITS